MVSDNVATERPTVRRNARRSNARRTLRETTVRINNLVVTVRQIRKKKNDALCNISWVACPFRRSERRRDLNTAEVDGDTKSGRLQPQRLMGPLLISDRGDAAALLDLRRVVRMAFAGEETLVAVLS